ncbi:MAG: hypothetical protein CMC15_16855 [Flavobacteriaceae bacterium]|nr:hypothetical protein [Flavobacteriaceae bacterium]
MDVLITRSTAVGGVHLEAGETHDLSEKDAITLISMGKAVDAADAPACPPTPPKPKAKKPKKAKPVIEEIEEEEDGAE